jgi:hypothetical protein
LTFVEDIQEDRFAFVTTGWYGGYGVERFTVKKEFLKLL